MAADLIEAAKKFGEWLLAFAVFHGLRVIGFAAILVWIIEAASVDVHAEPWQAALGAALTFFVGLEITFLGPMREREAKDDFARQKALALVVARLGEEQAADLLTDPLASSDEPVPILRSHERQRIISDARYMARSRTKLAAD